MTEQRDLRDAYSGSTGPFRILVDASQAQLDQDMMVSGQNDAALIAAQVRHRNRVCAAAAWAGISTNVPGDPKDAVALSWLAARLGQTLSSVS
jgi:hypothetical protein